MGDDEAGIKGDWSAPFGAPSLPIEYSEPSNSTLGYNLSIAAAREIGNDIFDG